MDSFPPEYPFGFGFGVGDGERPSPTRRELQGPRPTPLRVNKDSHKIKKPPVPPHPHLPRTAAAAPPAAVQNPQPVIIYAVSPKVIHTTVSDFMNVVQRLTGPYSGESSAVAGGSGALSPAARLASIEKTSPSEREKQTEMAAFDSNDVIEIVGNSTVEMGQIPGILSPAPTSLLPISPPGLFSPASDPLMFINNIWSMSPSALFSAPLISPSPSSLDLFNPFFDF